MLKKSFVVGLVGLSCTSACMMASRPAMVAKPTGEALVIVDDVVKWTTQEKVEVASVEYTDKNGGSAGKAKLYENREKVHAVNIWYPVQGRQQLSDEEFFQIAGDQDNLNRTLKLRSDGEKQQQQGQYVMMGGAAVAVAGLVLRYAAGVNAGYYLAMAGGLGVTGGYYYSMLGARMMSKDTHAVERADADRAAQQYNSKLGQVGYSGKF
ncbi:MAG: hypothetical protein KBG15_18480 [Kofleriaceae bacterium]|nr:hypothetical protein [Kofleriaceae bacterium]